MKLGEPATAQCAKIPDDGSNRTAIFSGVAEVCTLSAVYSVSQKIYPQGFLAIYPRLVTS